MTDRLVMVSGCFDPLHLGHINLFIAARALGTQLGVIINADEYVATKHKPMMTQFDRAQIIQRLDCVDFTAMNGREDGNVSDDLRLFTPCIYVVGPDYSDVEHLAEWKTCQELAIEVVCMNQLEKDRSSSLIIAEAAKPKWVNPPVTCSVILKRRDGKILLVRGQHGKLQVPGGFLEPDETLEQAVRRELNEEVGAGIAHLRYHESIIDTYPDGRQLVAVIFYGDIENEPQPTDECPELLWVTGIPDEEFFAASDRQALANYMGCK